MHLNNLNAKTLNFIKRNLCRCSQQTKSKAYLSLVRPTVEYASSTWDPYKINHISPLRKSKGELSTGYEYNYNHSVTTMLQNLSWPTLQYHHKRMHLPLLYKSISCLSALKISNTSINTITTSSLTNIKTDAFLWIALFLNYQRMEYLPPTYYCQFYNTQEQLDNYFN